MKQLLRFALSRDLVATNAARDIKVIGRRDQKSKKIIPPTKEAMKRLHACLKAIEPTATRCLGCHSRVVQVRLLGDEAVTWSWPAKSMQDTLTNRASLIFAEFWNKEYGQHFAGTIIRGILEMFGVSLYLHAQAR